MRYHIHMHPPLELVTIKKGSSSSSLRIIVPESILSSILHLPPSTKPSHIHLQTPHPPNQIDTYLGIKDPPPKTAPSPPLPSNPPSHSHSHSSNPFPVIHIPSATFPPKPHTTPVSFEHLFKSESTRSCWVRACEIEIGVFANDFSYWDIIWLGIMR